MTLAYHPDDTLAHRMDPRSKLAFQVAFAVAAFAHTTPTGLAVLSIIALSALGAARAPLQWALVEYRYAAPFLVAGPLVAALQFGPPWFDPARGANAALASYRVVLVLLVSAAYVRSTPVRESRAAIQHLVPGRAGAFLGAGVAILLRFLPTLQADLRRIRDASAARLGTERSVVDRIGVVGTAGIARAFRRADTLSLALRARCFAWNPTLPRLRFGAWDIPVLVLAGGLVGSLLM